MSQGDWAFPRKENWAFPRKRRRDEPGLPGRFVGMTKAMLSMVPLESSNPRESGSDAPFFARVPRRAGAASRRLESHDVFHFRVRLTHPG